MALCPDFSDSDDSVLSDDGDYDNFKKQVKNVSKPRESNSVDNEEETHNTKLKSLYSALSSGNIESVVEYIKNGIDVNVNVHSGWRPVHLSISYGNLELTRELIKLGANVKENRCYKGSTPLMMACNCPETTAPFERSLEIIKLLIENGADVESRDGRGMTALMVAAYTGNLEAVRYLTPLSDKDDKDSQQWTALFWAVNGNNPAVVKFLLDQGFEYRKTDIRDNTPLDIARRYDFHEIIEMFPEEQGIIISDILDSYCYGFEEAFENLKKAEKPKFLPNVFGILCGVRAESAIKVLTERNIGLYEFLSTTNEELKELGINLPYQRNRILGGLYRFHKHPFHSSSVYSVPLHEIYSTADMAIQALATVKQVIAIEAGMAFILKNYTDEVIPRSQMPLMAKSINTLHKKLFHIKAVTSNLNRKVKMLDSQLQHPDLITSKTKTYFLPWRKIVFSFSVFSLIVAFKIWK